MEIGSILDMGTTQLKTVEIIRSVSDPAVAGRKHEVTESSSGNGLNKVGAQ